MKKKILIVDDEPDLLILETARLQKAGYAVITAVNGKEALDLMQKVIPDLVLLDLNLPLINGADICKTIKSNDTLKHIPVILFTATFKEEILEKTRESGADDFIVKPFESEALLAKIEKFIAANSRITTRETYAKSRSPA